MLETIRLHRVFGLTDHLRNYLYIVKTVTPTDAVVQLKDDAHAELNVSRQRLSKGNTEIGNSTTWIGYSIN